MNKPKFQQVEAPTYVKELVADLQSRRWYGEVSLKFVAGKLSLLRTTETHVFDEKPT